MKKITKLLKNIDSLKIRKKWFQNIQCPDSFKNLQIGNTTMKKDRLDKRNKDSRLKKDNKT